MIPPHRPTLNVAKHFGPWCPGFPAALALVNTVDDAERTTRKTGQNDKEQGADARVLPATRRIGVFPWCPATLSKAIQPGWGASAPTFPPVCPMLLAAHKLRRRAT